MNEFNSILIDLESLNVKIEDEDKAILLVVSLPPSYKHFKEIMLYSNSNTISFEDVKSSLLPKEKFDHDIHGDCAEGLVIRVEQLKMGTVTGERTVLSLEILMLVRLAITTVYWTILLRTVGN